MMALDGLKELFLNDLLPDRKLKTISAMDAVSPKGLSKVAYTEICVKAYFEDYLKTAFAAFVQVLSEGTHSQTSYFKTNAIKVAAEILKNKPEQERALLGILVNKFGDTGSKISSTAAFALKGLLQAHPVMKSVVSKEIEGLLTRAGITQKTKYQAVLFLAEMTIQRSDGELPAQLIRCFARLLEAALKPKSAALEKKKVRKEVKTGRKRHRIIKLKRQAKTPGVEKGMIADDNRLVRTCINGIQRMMPFMDRIFVQSSLQAETVQTLFRVCHTVTAYSTRIAILSLLARLARMEQAVGGKATTRFYRLLYGQVAHFELFDCRHRFQAYNLVRNCVPTDEHIGRGVALARRVLQVASGMEPAVAECGLMVMRSMLAARRPEIKQLVDSVDATLESAHTEHGDDDEEHFGDDDAAEKPALTEADMEKRRYHPMAREPKFARARQAHLWELHALARHVHPDVTHAAEQLLNCRSFDDAGGDPNPFEAMAVSELLDHLRAARAGGMKAVDVRAAREGLPNAPV
eukprot:NODE_2947_length_2118_cov_4.925163.p1 GENE.NODE_2947_length_2118_cov_4.925163~~NODE_2947_length_2118_cov_4.925163.p1  ORF type:complete len:580 (+),score=226.58 NODE_2947_length_2118_cov_4.925163:181-1740(+)